MLKGKKMEKAGGWSRNIKGKKEKMVNRGCSQMLQINRAFSGGGVKVSPATVSQASEDTTQQGHISSLQKQTYFWRESVFKVKRILFESIGYTSCLLHPNSIIIVAVIVIVIIS